MTRLAFFALALALVACTAGDTPGTPSLVGSNWILKSMPGWQMQQAAQIPMIEFRSATEAGGRAGCNIWGGTYELKGNRIRFSATYMTEMACQYGMDVEQRFIDMLAQARTLTVEGETLTLADETNTELARFFRASKAVPPGN